MYTFMYFKLSLSNEYKYLNRRGNENVIGANWVHFDVRPLAKKMLSPPPPPKIRPKSQNDSLYGARAVCFLLCFVGK